MATPKEHIEELRRSKFSIGGKPNLLTEDLHQAVKNLSAELYAKDVHFLMEIIQNAEDNEYEEGVNPSLEFIVTSEDITDTGAPATLLIFNNEKGFSRKNVESICSVGRSTKKGQRKRGYIGEKGIGFKSVFLITAQPYIFSNGYQIKFNEEPCPHCNVGYIVPEWVEENPTPADIERIYGSPGSLPTTIIVLPLKPDKEQPVKRQLSNIHPEVLLFLSKIRRLSVRETNNDPKLNTVSGVSISSETDFITRKNVSAQSYTLHLSAEEKNDDGENECSYYMWKQKFPVKEENRVERRKEVDEWVITLAFPIQQRLSRGMKSPGLYSFLPTEMVTDFPFIIQADFLLASSRETILLDNKWNHGILNCVSSAFVNALISLMKSSEAAPISSLARVFKFLPVERSSYPKLNDVRDSIQEKVIKETIIPMESYTDQKIFCKPSDVGRISRDFWSILIKARAQGVCLHNLSSHGRFVVNSAFENDEYDSILKFLGVVFMDSEWYGKCIQSSNLVLGVSEDVYMKLLLFLSENWKASFKNTNIVNIPLLKYVDQDGNVSLCSVTEDEMSMCLSYDSCHISWLIDWNQEFRCRGNLFFAPKTTQDSLLVFPKRDTIRQWLKEHVEVGSMDVNDYALHLLEFLGKDRRAAVAFVHFVYHSLLKNYISKQEVKNLCEKIPLVDNYGRVRTPGSGVLVPANGSKWAGLIGSNPWLKKGFFELGEEYLRSGSFAGVFTAEKKLTGFLKTHVGASDIPNLCPPDNAIPTVSSPLTKENAFLILEWIKNLKHKNVLTGSKFLRCIKEGGWLRTYLGDSVGYKPPSESFLLTKKEGELLQNGSDLVDIPLIDQKFYDDRIYGYAEELKQIGVMFEFGEACTFIGKQLVSLAANTNLTKTNVFSILNFVRLLRKKVLPLDEFIESVKVGKWLKTSHGDRSPVGSILFDPEWKIASSISNLPFIDQECYGEEILSYKEELRLLGVLVGYTKDYQLLTDNFSLQASVTVDAFILALECIRHSRLSGKIISELKRVTLTTNVGSKSSCECFLSDPDWGSLLLVFNHLPVISKNLFGDNIFSYKNELKILGVVVDFEEAAKAFACQFKQHASSSSITKENVLSFLACYRQLKRTKHHFPTEFQTCIREEKWLKTCLGQKSPGESILFDPDWKPLSSIASLPFIDDRYYSNGIQEYKEELMILGVAGTIKTGTKFVADHINFPRNSTTVTPSTVMSFLECIRNLLEDHNGVLPDKFLGKISTRWLKTSMGYRSPDKCLLFDSKWNSFLQREDGPFIDEEFYGCKISSFRKELMAVGVVVDVANGCQLLANGLESHSHFDVIARIYGYLNEFKWKPDNKNANWIWIPNGNDGGEYVRTEECVIYDKDDLFGTQFNILAKHYKNKLLGFFSLTLEVRTNPSVDDYCKLWKDWEISGHKLTPKECCAFWMHMVNHWNSKTQKLLSENLVKLPVNTNSDVILLVDKHDIFIPDDLLLKDLFDQASLNPLFVWYPQLSLPSIPRTKLYEIYSSIGVRLISDSVRKDESSLPKDKLKKARSIIQEELLMLVLGFLADPALEMDAKKRQKTVKSLLDLDVFEIKDPITVSYSLPLSSGESLNVKECRMIRWEKESSVLFTQKLGRSSEHKTNIEFATYFSQVIAEGVLWERVDCIAGLSELLKLGWLLEFEEEAIDFLLKSKNLQLFMEDKEFLKSVFSSD
ncbi:hypothetical protein GIB67_041830 [Kingdonia uniflora]|uniref:Sacsin/Nov domain-containing protein n=1 Tax=Kingdonia uniflora TaxID=39325 RepID=A0A7J7L5R7_9MAGN|nr:hypothetical protein GIB67_041830 [Kingdonia uniflora]